MNLIKPIARYKNYLARSNGYVLVATFGLSLRNIFTDWKIVPAFIIGVSFMLFLGYIDCKLGLFKAEQQHTGSNHPILMEIYKKVCENDSELHNKKDN